MILNFKKYYAILKNSNLSSIKIVGADLPIYSVQGKNKKFLIAFWVIIASVFLGGINYFINSSHSLLASESSKNPMASIESNIATNLVDDLEAQIKVTEELLYSLSMQQGTARLYRFIKPTHNEIQSININDSYKH
jgi:hypothetical protein